MSDAEGGDPGQREIAYRVFAAEYDDADFSYSEGEEERAPNYVVTPTGARANRLFVVGVLTEIEPVSEDVLRARVVDPTGAFVVYAGQYQPDALAFLERADPPAFVAVTGKARTFQPEDSDRVLTSIRPESVNEVDADTRDRWTVQTAAQTLARVATAADALDRAERGDTLRDALAIGGVDEELAEGVALAVDHYGTSPGYLAAVRDLALDAARVVAGERDGVRSLGIAPDADEPADLAELAAIDVPGPGPAAGTEREDATGAGSGQAGVEPTAEPDDASEDTPDEPGAGAELRPESGSEFGTAAGDADGTGDGEGGAAEPATTTAGGDGDPGEFDPGEFELDDEEREEIESEYGTDFETATEVDSPGEAGIETPDADPGAGTGETGVEAVSGESEADAGADEPEADGTGTDDAGAGDAADVDLEDAVVDVMADLDDGDGAFREEVVARVVESRGADESAVEAAIEDALMSGRCYEPDDETLKPI